MAGEGDTESQSRTERLARFVGNQEDSGSLVVPLQARRSREALPLVFTIHQDVTLTDLVASARCAIGVDRLSPDDWSTRRSTVIASEEYAALPKIVETTSLLARLAAAFQISGWHTAAERR